MPRRENGPNARYFDREAPKWTDRYASSRHFRHRLKTATQWVNEEGNALELLDFGCGTGVMVRALSAMGHSVVGVDSSPGMLRAARAQTVDGARDVFEQVGIDFRGRYMSRTYDGVLCLGVLEYVEDESGLLQILANATRPGGFLILSFPNDRSWLRTLERLVHRRPGLFRAFGLFPHLTGPESYLNFQHHQFSAHAIKSFLDTKGLRLKRLQYHVAPDLMGRLETRSAVGMTALACFERVGS